MAHKTKKQAADAILAGIVYESKLVDRAACNHCEQVVAIADFLLNSRLDAQLIAQADPALLGDAVAPAVGAVVISAGAQALGQADAKWRIVASAQSHQSR
jgi:hypothetical protein